MIRRLGLAVVFAAIGAAALGAQQRFRAGVDVVSSSLST
jgi:hypothetical protein